MHAYLSNLSTYLSHALSDPHYINTSSAQEELNGFWKEGKELLDGDPELGTLLRNLSNEADRFMNDIKQDASINRLLHSAQRLGSHFSDLGITLFTSAYVPTSNTSIQTQLRKELWHDFVAYVVPRVLRLVKSLPIPRVEYASEMVDAVIDDVVLRGVFVPSFLGWEGRSAVRVRPSGYGYGSTGTTTTTTRQGQGMEMEMDNETRIHIEGLKFSAKLVSYFAEVKVAKGWLGWKDNGLLRVDIGGDPTSPSHPPPATSSAVDGITLDITLSSFPPSTPAVLPSASESSNTLPESTLASLNPFSTPDKPKSFFSQHAVNLTIPSLTISTSQSHHYIINTLLTPLVGPIARRVAGSIGSSIASDMIKRADEFSWRVDERARSIEGTRARLHAEQAVREGRATNADVKKDEEEAEGRIPPLSTYFTAFSQLRAEAAKEAEKEEEARKREREERGESELVSESAIHATSKGLVRTSVTHPAEDGAAAAGNGAHQNGEAEVVEESAIAVGVGAQLLPGKGGPSSEGRGMDAVVEEATETVDEVVETVEDAADKAKDVAENVREEVNEVKEELNEAGDVYNDTKGRERRVGGWRSEAFDL